ncbi:MAG TPA: hypothetical protein VFW27_23175 [Actinoplanes sp.]|nr:hypothetical protein [Actinoplanes sp.]
MLRPASRRAHHRAPFRDGGRRLDLLWLDLLWLDPLRHGLLRHAGRRL